MNAVSTPLESGYRAHPVELGQTPPPMLLPRRRRHILPGFHLTLGFTVFYLTAIVLLPLTTLFFKIITPTAAFPGVAQVVSHVFATAFDARALDSYRLSFGTALAAAVLNGIFGLVAAWALVRYQFPGKKIIDALVDLPFAMPTAVAGLALNQVFSDKGGCIGQLLHAWFGWQIVYTPWGILIALTFVGFPFVVRTLQPVLAELGAEVEEAAACLGANRWQTFRRVIFPAIRPALLTGIMLAFGRGVGEYGSVVFISTMVPYLTEITPQLIIIKLEENDYVAAAGLGVVMLLMSMLIVGLVNLIQALASHRRMTA